MPPQLAALLANWSGIEATRGGIDRTASDYVARRVRELELRSPEQYLELLTGPTCPEFQSLMDSITVTYTWFFRDSPQLSAIMQLLRDTPAHGGPLQVWVAGCATGEDVYSIAIASEELSRPVEVLGTDVNSRALDRARSGRYSAFSLRELPERFTGYFRRVAPDDWLIDASLRKAVRFETRNLVGPPALPTTGSAWDLILCRNVLIYFVREQAHTVFETLARSLRPAGHLMVGSSEIVFSLPPELEPVYVAETRLPACVRVQASRTAASQTKITDSERVSRSLARTATGAAQQRRRRGAARRPSNRRARTGRRAPGAALLARPRTRPARPRRTGGGPRAVSRRSGIGAQ